MLDPFLDARLLRHERARLCDSSKPGRQPASPPLICSIDVYQGVPFYVDERVIVPRSLIGELLMTAFAEDNAFTGDPGRIASALDLCTGGGSLAILPRGFSQRAGSTRSTSPSALEVASATSRSTGSQDRYAQGGRSLAPVKKGALRPDPHQPALRRRGDNRGISARISRPSPEWRMPAELTGSDRAPDPERARRRIWRRAGRWCARSAAARGCSSVISPAAVRLARHRGHVR